MEPLTPDQLLEKFIALANGKGGRFSHATCTPNRRIALHYRDEGQHTPLPRNFLNHTEALEHLYVAYNLKNECPYPSLARKRHGYERRVPSQLRGEFEALMRELYPDNATRR